MEKGLHSALETVNFAIGFLEQPREEQYNTRLDQKTQGKFINMTNWIVLGNAKA